MPPVARTWLDVARAAFFEELYRGRSVLVVGVGDGRAIEVLLERGAASVLGIDTDGEAIAAAQQTLAGRVEVRLALPGAVAGRFDVVMVQNGESLVGKAGLIGAVLDRLTPGGWLIASARSREHVEEGKAGRPEGVGYYDLLDRLAPHFPSVTMIGQAALAGATLATFGDEEAEPVLDAGLAGPAEAELYIAVAGPERPRLGYGLIVLPSAAQGPAGATRAGLDALRTALVQRDQKVARLEAEARAAQAKHDTEREIRREAQGETARQAEGEAEREAERQEELERLHGALTERNRELMRLQAELTDKEQQLGRRESDRGALEAALAEREQQVAQIEADRRALAAAHEALIAERAQHTERRDSDRKALEGALADRDQRIAKLEAERGAVETAVAAQVEKLARLLATERSLRGALGVRDERAGKLEAECKRLKATVERARSELPNHPQADLAALLQAREHGLVEMREAASLHEREMRAAQALLGERDAYIAELEEEVRAAAAARDVHEAATRRIAETETREREARRRIAELEGVLLRYAPRTLAAEAPLVDEARVGEITPPTENAPEDRAGLLAELEARCAKLKAIADDAQHEAWNHMKARSDAEAAAAEVREDTVRKLKDARKIANVELMRAMEEATRKAVTLKEELTRAEAERKEAVVELRSIRDGQAPLALALDQARAERSALIEELEALRRERARAARPSENGSVERPPCESHDSVSEERVSEAPVGEEPAQ